MEAAAAATPSQRIALTSSGGDDEGAILYGQHKQHRHISKSNGLDGT